MTALQIANQSGAMAPAAQWCVDSGATAGKRERLILEHMPQVRLIARRIQERLPQHISLDDLVSTGVLGLIAAIDHFDERHKVKLKTYAEYKIRSAILDSLREMDWVPRQKRRKARQIETAAAAVEQRLQRTPTEEETAAELRVSIGQFREWLLEVRGMNLERTRHAGGEEARSIIDSLPDKEENQPSHVVERRELRLLLADVVSRAPRVEQMVLRLYFQDGMTLRQIAAIAKVHESRISQIKTQAIRRLQKRMRPRWPTSRGI
jgi:RNA polymerase sigma factor for flagellar operon FliA